MCYSHIQSCVGALEICCANLNNEEKEFLELLKKLLITKYDKLNTLIPLQYGRLMEFQGRVNVLNDKLNPKVVKQQGAKQGAEES